MKQGNKAIQINISSKLRLWEMLSDTPGEPGKEWQAPPSIHPEARELESDIPAPTHGKDGRDFSALSCIERVAKKQIQMKGVENGL